MSLSNQMPDSPQLTSFNEEEQWLYSNLPVQSIFSVIYSNILRILLKLEENEKVKMCQTYLFSFLKHNFMT